MLKCSRNFPPITGPEVPPESTWEPTSAPPSQL